MNTQNSSNSSRGTHFRLGDTELGKLFREGPFSRKRQWETRFDKTGHRIRELGRWPFCLAEGGLFKQNKNRRVRVEEESKTSLCSRSPVLGQRVRVKGVYLAPHFW